MWLSPATATNRVAVARVLAEQLPATLGALRSGEIDWRRAAAVAEVAGSHGAEIARAVEQRVLSKAGTRTPAQHRAAIRRAVLQVDPQTAEERHARAAADRRVGFYPGEDGMGQVVADLTGDGLAVLRAALDAAAAGIKSACPGETRSMDQLRADALVHLARLSLRTGWLAGVTDPDQGGVRLASAQRRRPLIQVTVPYSTLIGVDDQPGDLQGYGPIPASVARRIAGDGTWRRLLTDPATGALHDYGTTRYEPPADLREHVIARDQTCVMPVCGQPAHRCQLDHTIPHPEGPTSPSNLGPLHQPHHDGKTRGHWKLAQPQPGRFEWTSPAGKTYVREPAQVGPIIDPPDGDGDHPPGAEPRDDHPPGRPPDDQDIPPF